jgi:hypothetical protein
MYLYHADADFVKPGARDSGEALSARISLRALSSKRFITGENTAGFFCARRFSPLQGNPRNVCAHSLSRFSGVRYGRQAAFQSKNF